MPAIPIKVTHGNMSPSGSINFAWIEYSGHHLPDDAQALLMASENDQLVRVIGPTFSIQGRVVAVSTLPGAKFCIIRSDT